MQSKHASNNKLYNFVEDCKTAEPFALDWAHSSHRSSGFNIHTRKSPSQSFFCREAGEKQRAVCTMHHVVARGGVSRGEGR